MTVTEIEYPHRRGLAQLLITDHPAITNALECHARRMQESADSALAAWQAAEGRPEAIAAQDATMITHNGLKGIGETFSREAREARRLAATIRHLLDGEEHYYDDGTEDGAVLTAASPAVQR
jgi:hypothetical protein